MKKILITTLMVLWSGSAFAITPVDPLTDNQYSERATKYNANDAELELDKAEKSNVLGLDNTDIYTPTLDYHPATVKYVDANAIPTASTAIASLEGKGWTVTVDA